ncbi:uncharacterized protein LOC131154511 [Malania oleifera]|uniref:uncharacterized protein LOC131154511 n=1 Tax=Malania oleifera TaxID=397392 RepID=UPI0025AE09E4|nr:uncharacterized protein LOC131154511 [Malania oleifera]
MGGIGNVRAGGGFQSSRPRRSSGSYHRGKMIGSAKACEGLYYFEEANTSEQCNTVICVLHLFLEIDGFDYLNNIFLIGTTNQQDIIDKILLRPGRLELNLEISIPNEQGREQILKVHSSNI